MDEDLNRQLEDLRSQLQKLAQQLLQLEVRHGGRIGRLDEKISNLARPLQEQTNAPPL